MTLPFVDVVSMNREDAAEWANPDPCYGVDYLGQADPHQYRFGAKRYRVWRTPPTDQLRQLWNAA